MAAGRDVDLDERQTCGSDRGPGHLAEAFGITPERDKEDLTSPKSDLWITDDGFRPQRIEDHATHRHHQSRRATPAYIIPETDCFPVKRRRPAATPCSASNFTGRMQLIERTKSD